MKTFASQFIQDNSRKTQREVYLAQVKAAGEAAKKSAEFSFSELNSLMAHLAATKNW